MHNILCKDAILKPDYGFSAFYSPTCESMIFIEYTALYRYVAVTNTHASAMATLSAPINRSELTVRLRSLLRIYKFNQELIGLTRKSSAPASKALVFSSALLSDVARMTGINCSRLSLFRV